MTETTGRAVVLGASMAGLLAARVLAETYDEVLLIDRDRVQGEQGYRQGVPHGRHAHGLVARGHQIMESQFPGLTDDMRAAGVTPGDFNGDIRWYVNGRRMLPSRSGLLSVPATRPVLERVLRERVQAIPQVRFLEEYDIVGLLADETGGRILGARIQRRDGSTEEAIPADLVLDTTGRGSRTPAWLAELGYERPAEDRVKVNLAYTTRHYRLDSDPFDGDLALIPAPTPACPRGAFFYPLPGGDGRVELSLTGLLGDHPPTDADGFLEFTRSLPVPEIYQAVRDAEPLNDPVTFRYPASVRRRYERLTRFPAGLLVLGDAVCSFNPVYAQGMTVAAIESLVLRDHLRRDRLDPAAFFRDIAREIDSPWEFTAGADLGFAGVEGRRTAKVRFANAYVARLQEAATRDATLTDAFIRVAGLIDPPSSLMRPATMLRVLRQRRAAVPAPLMSFTTRETAEHRRSEVN
jgi:2-polyprenyl-6-methoxyphenol hydroxylase-like FAD-dependent oxidoreductase